MEKNRLVYRFGRNAWRNQETGNTKEWLLTNGIGGFANSTVSGNNNRIFSAYMIASLHPPVERMLILAKTHEAIRLEVPEASKNGQGAADRQQAELIDLAAQEYPGQKREGYRHLSSFTYDVLPEYCYQAKGVTLRKKLAMERGRNAVVLHYEICNDSSRRAMISVTPLMNFRPFGAVSTRAELNFEISLCEEEGRLTLTPAKAREWEIRLWASEGNFYYRGQYPVSMATPNYLADENELYATDVMNGFTGVDCHFTPYEVRVIAEPGEYKSFDMVCELVPSASGTGSETVSQRAARVIAECENRTEELIAKAGSRDAFTGRLVLSADHFLVKRESTGKMTILAGYPWFADWGRDTMIAFTGLTLATGRFEEAAQVLESFAKYVDRGMIPNVFPDHAGQTPMYNTIDASLWFFYAVLQYLKYTTHYECYYGEREIKKAALPVPEQLSAEERFIRDNIYPGLRDIFAAYRDGTARYGIHMDDDGLIMGGSNLDQLTWMDVRVGELVVTPRHGKAVEINALWYNALRCMEIFMERFGDTGTVHDLAEKVKVSFGKAFWNDDAGCLADVIAPDGTKDTSIRPNQIFAVSLPFSLLSENQAKQVVQTVYEKLYTPYGLRSLAQDETGYRGRYIGKLLERDMAYHMGTAWGYLAGAFITAWLYTGGSVCEAREMCLRFMDHMADGCLGGIAEIFDGDFADAGRGCYTQAWSVGEVLRAAVELEQFGDEANM